MTILILKHLLSMKCFLRNALSDRNGVFFNIEPTHCGNYGNGAIFQHGNRLVECFWDEDNNVCTFNAMHGKHDNDKQSDQAFLKNLATDFKRKLHDMLKANGLRVFCKINHENGMPCLIASLYLNNKLTHIENNKKNNSIPCHTQRDSTT